MAYRSIIEQLGRDFRFGFRSEQATVFFFRYARALAS